MMQKKHKTLMPRLIAVVAVMFMAILIVDKLRSQGDPVNHLEVTNGDDPFVSDFGYGFGAEPTNVQGVVNRVHAIVVARVASFNGSRIEGPYVDGELTEAPTPVPGEPPIAMESGYFSFNIEKVLLDDGFIDDAPVFRGVPEEDHIFNPDVGERYVLALLRNPDDESYGAVPSFGMIELNDGKATRRDGSAPPFEGPTDEEALIEAFEDAVEVRRHVPIGEWNEPYADLPRTAE
ncbi:MAG: hypothetical protein WD208_05685 [Dehalococcoidia bacterium]